MRGITMFGPDIERRLSLTMLIIDSTLAAWVVKNAWSVVRTGPRRYAARMVVLAGVSTGVAIWRAMEHRELLEEQKLDVFLEDPYEEDTDELAEDADDGWIFKDHFSGSDIDELVKEHQEQRHWPLSPVAPLPPEQMTTTFAPYYLVPEDE